MVYFTIIKNLYLRFKSSSIVVEYRLCKVLGRNEKSIVIKLSQEDRENYERILIKLHQLKPSDYGISMTKSELVYFLRNTKFIGSITLTTRIWFSEVQLIRNCSIKRYNIKTHLVDIQDEIKSQAILFNLICYEIGLVKDVILSILSLLVIL